MRRRLLQVDYDRGEDEVVMRLRPRQLRVLPATTMGHLMAANKEFLLALRSLIDGVIQRMEPSQEGGPQAQAH